MNAQECSCLRSFGILDLFWPNEWALDVCAAPKDVNIFVLVTLYMCAEMTVWGEAPDNMHDKSPHQTQ